MNDVKAWAADHLISSLPTQFLVALLRFWVGCAGEGGITSCDSSPFPSPPSLGPRRKGLEPLLWFFRSHSNRAVVFANLLQSWTLLTSDDGLGSASRGGIQAKVQPSHFPRDSGKVRAGGRGALL